MHLEVPIPQCISGGSNFVVTTAVDILRNPAGYDRRIQRRDETMRKADLAYNIRRIEDVYEVLSHFEVCEGPTHSFAMQDRLDWKSSAPTDEPTALDALLGEGDGGTDEFQLRKGYVRGAVTKYRTIALPLAGSVLIAVDGVLQTITTHYLVNLTTGVVTFQPGFIPGTGAQVTAGFKFHIKVRFDTNDLSQVYEGFRVGAVTSVPVIEVRQ